MNFIETVKATAKNNPKRIVLPEGMEERTLQAADRVIKEKIAQIIIIGQPDEIQKKADQLNLQYISQAKIVDPHMHDKLNFYTDLMVELRHTKGVTKEKALELIENPLYLAGLMVKTGDADGEVAGAMNATGDVLRPAFQYIKTAKGISVVSGAFIMIMQDNEFGEEGILFFADCAVNPDPSEQELAEIAITSAKTFKFLVGAEPRIAMLSFSTKGSASHKMIDKVANATKIAKDLDSSLIIDGELQADTAIIEKVFKIKAPDSPVQGKANILIFPSLDAGNIAYKLTERLAHAKALGPILQGLTAPVNDLSRGCSVEDIVNLIAITAVQAAAV